MTPAYDRVLQCLRKLPGLGHRSAQRVALHLLLERPESLAPLLEALNTAARQLKRCERCGNLSEGGLCSICSNPNRDPSILCVVETVPDLLALESAGAFQGLYHVLHGKLSPLQGVGPEALNLASLGRRLREEPVEELVLALGSDVESEATCHYLQQEIVGALPVRLTRIGFGLPRGGALPFADSQTLQHALMSRRSWGDT